MCVNRPSGANQMPPLWSVGDLDEYHNARVHVMCRFCWSTSEKHFDTCSLPKSSQATAAAGTAKMPLNPRHQVRPAAEWLASTLSTDSSMLLVALCPNSVKSSTALTLFFCLSKHLWHGTTPALKLARERRASLAQLMELSLSTSWSLEPHEAPDSFACTLVYGRTPCSWRASCAKETTSVKISCMSSVAFRVNPSGQLPVREQGSGRDRRPVPRRGRK